MCCARRAFVLTLLFFSTITSCWALPMEEVPTVIERNDATYRIALDGSFTEELDVIKTIQTARGIQEGSQKQIAYSDALQSIDVLEAYTETQDGKKILVGKDKIFTQESPTSTYAAMFSDYKIKVIVFPQVDVGSKIRYRYVLRQKTALFPGQFSFIEYYPLDQQMDDAKLTVIAPKEMKFYTQAIAMQGGSITCPSTEKDKQCFVWTTKNPTMQPPEPMSVADLDYSPRVAMSTFTNYAAVAAAYEGRAADKSKITPQIQKLADTVTKGIDEKAKQAKAIYNWVSKNIRYVAIYLGAGGVVPHQADMILTNRYGDCKDHVALLQALLAAKGIETSGALVNLGTSYWLPEVATAPGVFNHVITYIPSMHIYVDSTLQFAPFGDLSATELGKPVLIVKPIPGREPLDVLPLEGSSPTRTHVVVKMKTTTDGTVTGTATVQNSGTGEFAERLIMANLPVGQDETISNQMLANTGQSGSGTFNKNDPSDLSKPYEYDTRFKLPNLIHIPGPGAFTMPTGLHGFLGIEGIVGLTAKEEHQFPMGGMADFSKHEEYTLELPKDIKVTTVPRNVDLKMVAGEYKAIYELKGQTLHAVRDMKIAGHSAIYSPAQYKELRILGQEIAKDLRAQVLYQ